MEKLKAPPSVTIPFEFRQPDRRLYPGDNDPDFEYWYSKNFTPGGDRIYLGVLWTSFYKSADYGNKKEPIRKLQMFLNRLDRKKKYYTCAQYDDGILNDLSHLDCKVFSMSGKPMDYPLPLICQPHKFIPESNKRPYLVNFIGNNTHPIRSEILKIKLKGWFIDSTHHKMDFYCRTIASSVFTLCPRGYGKNSFRTCESLQYGSLPVYISDEYVIAHSVPFESYGFLITPEQIPDLPNILNSIPQEEIRHKQSISKYIFDTYYSFEGTKKLIEENL